MKCWRNSSRHSGQGWPESNVMEDKKRIEALQKYIALAFLFLALFIYGHYIYHIIKLKVVIDFAMFYHSATHFWQGQSIYLAVPWRQYHAPVWMLHEKIIIPPPTKSLGLNFNPNLNPPVFTLLLLPLGLLSYKLALLIWELLMLLASMISVRVIYQNFFAEQKNHFGYWVLLGIYLAAIPVYNNMTLGQVGIFTLLAIIFVWQWSRKQYDVRAGILLGLLLSIKYFFGLLALIFLLQKRWRVVFFSVLTFILLNAVAWLLFGKSAFQQYIEIVRVITWFANAWNASLYGFFSKLMGHMTSPTSYVVSIWGKICYGLCSAALILYQIKICLKSFKSVEEFDFAFAYVCICSILICPLGWTYYLPVMILPLVMLTKNFAVNKRVVVLPQVFIFSFTLGLLFYPTPLQVVTTVGAINLFFINSCYFYGMILLLGLMIFYRKHLIQVTHEKLELFPWTVLAYLTVSPGLMMLFYCAFIRVPRIWE